MKRILFLLTIIALFLSVSMAEAQIVGSPRSSGLKSADAAIMTVGGYFYGVDIITDGTNDATVVIYDNASAASGTELFKGKVAGGNNFGGAIFVNPIRAVNGIYADVTGTGANYIVYYAPR